MKEIEPPKAIIKAYSQLTHTVRWLKVDNKTMEQVKIWNQIPQNYIFMSI